jgi:ABC-2 type transport system ATP-binding protein
VNAIEVKHLRRVFTTNVGRIRRQVKEVVAVDDVSFEIADGELFGLLGPNGAGKTTTVKMLTTLLIPTSGTATIDGKDVVKEADGIRQNIGFIFGGERGLYWRLSANDNLRYFASLYNVDPEISAKRIPYLLELVGLKGREKEKVEGYSRGMKQRLHIARSLIHDPKILFLDEPTIGLDPVGARELRTVVRDLQNQKKTILLTTHYMFEADALCQRVAVINHGNIVAMDTPAKLKNVVQDLSVIEVETFGISEEVVNQLRGLDFVDNVSVEDNEQKQMLYVQTTRGSAAIPDLMKLMDGQKVGHVIAREPTLEDAYVRLVGNSRGSD